MDLSDEGGCPPCVNEYNFGKKFPPQVYQINLRKSVQISLWNIRSNLHILIKGTFSAMEGYYNFTRSIRHPAGALCLQLGRLHTASNVTNIYVYCSKLWFSCCKLKCLCVIPCNSLKSWFYSYLQQLFSLRRFIAVYTRWSRGLFLFIDICEASNFIQNFKKYICSIDK